mgnify:FL=1
MILKILFYITLFIASMLILAFGLIIISEPEMIYTSNLKLISVAAIFVGLMVSVHSLKWIFTSPSEDEERRNTLIYDKRTMRFKRKADW